MRTLMTDRLRRFHGTDRLFFAVLPDPDTAACIGDLAQRLRGRHGLTGPAVKTEHFHVTLCHVCDSVGLPPELIDAVSNRAASVVMPAFRAEFDRVMSFRNGALVLAGDDSTIGLEILHQRLSDALDTRPQKARQFTPHLTLLRDRQHVPEISIEPVGWTAHELVLVHSLLGRGTHRHVARFPLH